VLAWLACTGDIWRRAKPATPSPHLVSYFLLVDPEERRVLLCDHRFSGLWLPTGGHVEAGEHPLDTVRREVAGELGLSEVTLLPDAPAPFFTTWIPRACSKSGTRRGVGVTRRGCGSRADTAGAGIVTGV